MQEREGYRVARCDLGSVLTHIPQEFASGCIIASQAGDVDRQAACGHIGKGILPGGSDVVYDVARESTVELYTELICSVVNFDCQLVSPER